MKMGRMDMIAIPLPKITAASKAPESEFRFSMGVILGWYAAGLEYWKYFCGDEI
jgi:hypothetical protein